MDTKIKTPKLTQKPAAATLEIFTSRQFVSWLAAMGSSLVLTTYQSSKVIFIGANAKTGKLTIFERTLERPMGIAVSGNRLSIASLYQVYTFIDAVAEDAPGDSPEAVFVPQFSHFTGDLDVHDLAYDAEGRLVFANTLFSCLSAVSATHSFKPLWKPDFISRLAPEDRCHLNGLAMRDGKPAYVTAVGAGDVGDSWRDNRTAGGVVIDVETGETVCRGLSMPHSPRWHDGRLWVLNSGRGEIGTVNFATQTFEPIAFLPGYLRGLAFIGDQAIVGLSAPRNNRTFEGLELQARLDKENMKPRCGISNVDTKTGDIAHWLTMEGVVTELFDVAVLEGKRSPTMIGFKTDEIRRVISMEPAD